MSSAPYRVVQWATGNIGLRSLRAVIEHPDLELVGLYVYSEPRPGRTRVSCAGDHRWAWLPRATSTRSSPCIRTASSIWETGWTSTPSAGCSSRVRTSCRRAANSTVLPASIPQPRSRLEDACARGGSTLFSTGSSPGFITEALPFALLSMQRRLDRLVIEEFADMSSRNSPEMIFDLMGFGRDPSHFDPPWRGGPRWRLVRRVPRHGRRRTVPSARRSGGEGPGGRCPTRNRHRGGTDRGWHHRGAAAGGHGHTRWPAPPLLQRQLVSHR